MAVRGIELLVIKDYPSKKESGAGVKIRVVQWVYDNGSSVKLERRGYFTKEGRVLTGKAEGLGWSDLEHIRPRWKEIVHLMTNPPEVKPIDKPKARQEDEEIEEVPF